MKKHVSNIEKCYKNFKTITKIKIIRKEIYQKHYTKNTNESGSLSYKSKDKNKSKYSLGGLKLIKIFNIPVWYRYNCNFLLHNKPPLSLSP